MTGDKITRRLHGVQNSVKIFWKWLETSKNAIKKIFLFVRGAHN